MIHLNNRSRTVLLALTLLVTGQASALWPVADITVPSMPAWLPAKEQVAGIMALAMYIRLYTKGSKFDYSASDWSGDLNDLKSSFNLLDSETYKKLVALFDKWAIGRMIKIDTVEVKTTKEDGTIEAVPVKRLKCDSFGALGLFHAYMIVPLEEFGKIATNLGKTQELTRGTFGIDLGYVTK